MDASVDPFLENLQSLKDILSSPSRISNKNRRNSSDGSYSSNRRFFDKEQKELKEKLKEAQETVKKEKSLRESLEISFEKLTAHRKELAAQLDDEKRERLDAERRINKVECESNDNKVTFDFERKLFDDKHARSATELADALTKKDEIEVRLQAAESKAKDLASRLADSEKTVGGKAHNSETALKELQQKHETLTSDHEATKFTLDITQTELTESKARLSEVQEALRQAQSEARSTDVVKKRLEEQLAAQMSVIERLKSVQELQRSKIENLVSESKRSKGLAAKEFADREEDYKKKVQSLEATLAEAKVHNACSEREQQYKNEIETLQTTLNETNDLLSISDVNLRHRRDEIAKLEAECKKRKTEVDDLRASAKKARPDEDMLLV